jgi:hypothetical protein
MAPQRIAVLSRFWTGVPPKRGELWRTEKPKKLSKLLTSFNNFAWLCMALHSQFSGAGAIGL